MDAVLNGAGNILLRPSSIAEVFRFETFKFRGGLTNNLVNVNEHGLFALFLILGVLNFGLYFCGEVCWYWR